MIKFKWETEFKETPIGEIPKDWNVKEIQEVMFINKRPKNGQNKPIAFIPMEKIPVDGMLPEFEFRTPNEVKSGIEVPPSSILLAKITPSFEHGKMCIVPNNFNYRWIATTEVFSLIPRDNKVSTKFVFYYLRHPIPKDILEYSMTGTSGRQRVDRHALETLLLPYPSPEEQQGIADVLSWFDDLIENKRKQNEILEKTAMAIFKSWFIDFEPFQDEEFVYSEKLDMEIPKGWEVKSIGEIVKLIKGVSYKSNEIKDKKETDKDMVFITLKSFQRGGGFRPEYKYYGGNKLKKNTFVGDGDLIIGITDMTPDAKVVGAPALVVLPPWEDTGVISLDCAKLSTIEYFKEYLYLFLKITQEENSTFANGVNVLHLNTKLFAQSKFILVPPKPILEKFHSLVEPLFRKIILNEKEIMLLKKIRDTLLPQLVFGRLRVVGI
ncbi:MAG: restriction endonuclease subunit S [Thermoproteota archaeon]|nr:MAG: restriction endonuclease subunit S [Candidatus Korarchaeota archaeon]RLG50007.1 MAG: restriction endonuclease subunit S [Candidatus Korarchaeota archaeon]